MTSTSSFLRPSSSSLSSSSSSSSLSSLSSLSHSGDDLSVDLPGSLRLRLAAVTAQLQHSNPNPNQVRQTNLHQKDDAQRKATLENNQGTTQDRREKQTKHDDIKYPIRFNEIPIQLQPLKPQPPHSTNTDLSNSIESSSSNDRIIHRAASELRESPTLFAPPTASTSSSVADSATSSPYQFQLSQLESLNHQLRSELSDAHRKLESYKSQIYALEKIKIDLREESRTLAEQLQKSRDTLEDRRYAEKEQHRQTEQQLADWKAEAERVIHGFEDELRKRIEENAYLKRQLADTEDKLRNVESTLADQRAAHKKQTAIDRTWKLQVEAELKKAMRTLCIERNTALKQVQQLDDDLQHERRRVTDVESEKSNLLDQLYSASRLAREAPRECLSAEVMLCQMQRSEIEALNKRLNECETTRRERLEAMRDEMRGVNEENTELRTTVEELKVALTKCMKAMDQANEEANTKIKALEDEVKQLKEAGTAASVSDVQTADSSANTNPSPPPPIQPSILPVAITSPPSGAAGVSNATPSVDPANQLHQPNHATLLSTTLATPTTPTTPVAFTNASTDDQPISSVTSIVQPEVPSSNPPPAPAPTTVPPRPQPQPQPPADIISSASPTSLTSVPLPLHPSLTSHDALLSTHRLLEAEQIASEERRLRRAERRAALEREQIELEQEEAAAAVTVTPVTNGNSQMTSTTIDKLKPTVVATEQAKITSPTASAVIAPLEHIPKVLAANSTVPLNIPSTASSSLSSSAASTAALSSQTIVISANPLPSPPASVPSIAPPAPASAPSSVSTSSIIPSVTFDFSYMDDMPSFQPLAEPPSKFSHATAIDVVNQHAASPTSSVAAMNIAAQCDAQLTAAIQKAVRAVEADRLKGMLEQDRTPVQSVSQSSHPPESTPSNGSFDTATRLATAMEALLRGRDMADLLEFTRHPIVPAARQSQSNSPRRVVRNGSELNKENIHANLSTVYEPSPTVLAAAGESDNLNKCSAAPKKDLTRLAPLQTKPVIPKLSLHAGMSTKNPRSTLVHRAIADDNILIDGRSSRSSARSTSSSSSSSSRTRSQSQVKKPVSNSSTILKNVAGSIKKQKRGVTSK